MRFIVIALMFLIVGCASDPAKRAAVANEEVSRLAPPQKHLAEFSNFELKPMVMGEKIKPHEEKIAVSKELDAKLNARIMPLLATWRASNILKNQSSTLVIEPIMQELRIISRGTRFWAGAFAGDSFIDMDLKLTDTSTNQVIAMPRIRQDVGAMVGAWSIGATDHNLLDYITDIAYRYLEANH